MDGHEDSGSCSLVLVNILPKVLTLTVMLDCEIYYIHNTPFSFPPFFYASSFRGC